MNVTPMSIIIYFKPIHLEIRQIIQPLYDLRGVWFSQFTFLLIILFPVVFSILASLPTASITPLKQPYCISTTISLMPSDHRSCHVCLIDLSAAFDIIHQEHPNYSPFILVWNSRLCLKLIFSRPY